MSKVEKIVNNSNVVKIKDTFSNVKPFLRKLGFSKDVDSDEDTFSVRIETYVHCTTLGYQLIDLGTHEIEVNRKHLEFAIGVYVQNQFHELTSKGDLGILQINYSVLEAV